MCHSAGSGHVPGEDGDSARAGSISSLASVLCTGLSYSLGMICIYCTTMAIHVKDPSAASDRSIAIWGLFDVNFLRIHMGESRCPYGTPGRKAA